MCSGLQVKKLRVHRTLRPLWNKICYFCRRDVFQAFTGAVILGFLLCAEPELGVEDCHASRYEPNVETSGTDQWNGLKPLRLLIRIFCKSPLKCITLRRVKAAQKPPSVFKVWLSFVKLNWKHPDMLLKHLCSQMTTWHKVLAPVRKPPSALDECCRFIFSYRSSALLRAWFQCSACLFSFCPYGWIFIAHLPLIMSHHNHVWMQKRLISVPLVTQENDQSMREHSFSPFHFQQWFSSGSETCSCFWRHVRFSEKVPLNSQIKKMTHLKYSWDPDAISVYKNGWW